MNKTQAILTALAAALLMGSCKPRVPREYIQPDEMEDLLYDYYIARAMATRGDSVGYKQRAYQLAVLRQHGVTEAEFDSSLIYYYRNAERLNKIYAAVTSRLEGKAQQLGASAGEMGKYATLSATGDTADIWNDARRTLLLPLPPYNRMDFRLEADTTYRRGDSFQLNLRTLFMYQSGSKDCVAYVAVDYAGDSTAVYNRRISGSDEYKLSIPANHEADIKAIRGFIYLGNGLTQSALQKLLFIDGIQLVRFHPQEADVKAAEERKQNEAKEKARIDSIQRADTLGAKPGMVKMRNAMPLTR